MTNYYQHIDYKQMREMLDNGQKSLSAASRRLQQIQSIPENELLQRKVIDVVDQEISGVRYRQRSMIIQLLKGDPDETGNPGIHGLNDIIYLNNTIQDLLSVADQTVRFFDRTSSNRFITSGKREFRGGMQVLTILNPEPSVLESVQVMVVKQRAKYPEFIEVMEKLNPSSCNGACMVAVAKPGPDTILDDVMVKFRLV
uniref:Uncharacterized protein n=1 Tax=Spongospora subterranea TaxID=70186 RepID=A0A0H5R4L8_9EUKA|eukprot:CRZ09083.1 hypothetical protein [Spongospora subterranea]